MSQEQQERTFSTQERLRIAGASSQGLLQHLDHCTVGLFDQKSGKISSGTLVQIIDRVFIATADHNISSDPNHELMVLPDKPRRKTEGFLRPQFVASNSFYDVGILEVRPDAVTEYFDSVTCCDLNRLSIMGTGSQQLTVLVGNPGQFVETNNITDGAPFVAKLMSFSTTVLSPPEWPQTFVGRPIDQTIDVFMQYPDQGNTRFDTNEPVVLSTPHGFSGGGIWSAEFRQGEVWSPASSQLFAIEIEWDKSQRIIRGTQIIHWLNLVRSKVPELRTELEQTFSALTAMQLI